MENHVADSGVTQAAPRSSTKESVCDPHLPISNELRELLIRVERQVGDDRALDRDITLYCHKHIVRLPFFVETPKFTSSIDVAMMLLPEGFWWRGGICGVSSEILVCPDHNLPDHRTRLMRECPPSIAHWDSGIEVTIWPGGYEAFIRAIISVCLRAEFARAS